MSVRVAKGGMEWCSSGRGSIWLTTTTLSLASERKGLQEERGSRSVQRQGRGLGHRVGKEQAADTPFPPASPFHLEGLEGLGRNYLVAKMKTSRGLSLTRDSIIGTDGCKETLAFSNHYFQTLLFIFSQP